MLIYYHNMAYIVNIHLIRVIATIKTSQNGSMRHYQSHLWLVFLKLPLGKVKEEALSAYSTGAVEHI